MDVGLRCVHSCKHCFYSYLGGLDDQFAGMRRAGWHRIEHLLALVDRLAEQRFIGFDVTGGEPTAYPHLVDVVKRASKNGTAARIITLGQFLTRRDLLARLLDAGVTDFRLSLHAVEAEMFRRMTGGDLSLMLAAMDALQKIGFQYVTNTTITEENYRALPEIGRFIASRPEIYQANFLFFMPYYEWAGKHAGEHRIRYTEIAEYLREAVSVVEAAGVGCTIRYAPQCTIKGMERNHVGITGVRHDIHEWMNAIVHGADPETTDEQAMRDMGNRLPVSEFEAHYPLRPTNTAGLVAERANKAFPDKCRGCAAIHVCDGVDRAYLAAFGDGELRPYRELRGDIIDRDRLLYLPGYVIKTAPYADAKSAVREAFAAMQTSIAEAA